MKHLPPSAQVSLKRVQPAAARPFGADPGIVDERVQLAAQRFLDAFKGRNRFVGAGQINLHMVRLPIGPRAARIEGVTRAGQHPPPFAFKTLDGGMADAARCPGQEEGFLVRHDGLHFEADLRPMRGMCKRCAGQSPLGRGGEKPYGAEKIGGRHGKTDPHRPRRQNHRQDAV